jgi:hypothetical protein
MHRQPTDQLITSRTFAEREMAASFLRELIIAVYGLSWLCDNNYLSRLVRISSSGLNIRESFTLDCGTLDN